MNYWLINPKNEGTSTSTQNISVNLVKMGWDEDNCPKFYNDVKVGDIIIVCEGSHSNNKCHYVGVADKLDKDEHCWHLKHSSIDYNDIISDTIKSCPGDFGGGESKNPWGPSKSIIRLESKPTEIKLKGTLNSIVQNMKIEELENILRNNSNLILTGAPGTGKTYLAKEIAAKLIFDKDYSNEIEQDELFKYHIGFVQFHPSYDYTDFVEGLRPKEKGTGFKRVDGVFKKFCKDALSLNTDTCLKYFIESKTLLKTNGESRVEFMISEFNDKTIQIVNQNQNTYPIDYFALKVALNSNEDISSLWFENYLEANGILLFEGQKNNLVSHYYYSTYLKIKEFPFVFIIDEINRGELSKIFGELFFSIDPGYRGVKGRVKTQYQNLVEEDDPFKNGFYVPENVYIIGTMNDIDRSVESIDFAMRRRFAWKEILVESRQSMLDEKDAWGKSGMPSLDIINEIKNRMNNLNACIIDEYGEENLSAKDRIGLSKAYQIGASYFLKYNQYKYNNFGNLWENHIKGLLYEYLRGATNIETKIQRLEAAYNDTKKH